MPEVEVCSKIPEVEMLMKTINYIVENDTSDGNIKETGEQLKAYVIKLVKESIIFNNIKINNPTVSWINIDTDTKLEYNDVDDNIEVRILDTNYSYKKRD